MLLSRLFRDGQTDGRTRTDGPTTGHGDSSIAPNTSGWGYYNTSNILIYSQ